MSTKTETTVNTKRTKTGTVVSNKMNKTLVIKVDTYKNHPKYKKRYRVSSKFYADCADEKKFNVGDTVTIVETPPKSKLKRWKVID